MPNSCLLGGKATIWFSLNILRSLYELFISQKPNSQLLSAWLVFCLIWPQEHWAKKWPILNTVQFKVQAHLDVFLSVTRHLKLLFAKRRRICWPAPLMQRKHLIFPVVRSLFPDKERGKKEGERWKNERGSPSMHSALWSQLSQEALVLWFRGLQRYGSISVGNKSTSIHPATCI